MHKVKTISVDRALQNFLNGGRVLSFRSRLTGKNGDEYTGLLVTKNNVPYRLKREVHEQLKFYV